MWWRHTSWPPPSWETDQGSSTLQSQPLGIISAASFSTITATHLGWCFSLAIDVSDNTSLTFSSSVDELH
jgi:hypothetical protein